jgi:hypothetical protein
VCLKGSTCICTLWRFAKFVYRVGGYKEIKLNALSGVCRLWRREFRGYHVDCG